MKVLFLSQIVPYPPHGGVLQRGYNIIREISRYNTVHLLAFIHPEVLKTGNEIEDAKNELGKFCERVEFFPLWVKESRMNKYAGLLSGLFSSKPFSVLAHRSKLMEQSIGRLLQGEKFELVHYDTLALSRFNRNDLEITKVVTHHNIESTLMQRRAQVERSILAKYYLSRQAERLRDYEKTETGKFGVNIVMSAKDGEELRKINPNVNIEVVPNGVDTTYFTPGQGEETTSVIYTGGMNMFANRDAVLYFLEDIWPLIKAREPNVRFYAIGQDPPAELIRISKQDPHVIVTGYVDDVRPFVREAAVYVVPLRVGGGTRLKILDAMAMGKAVVSTSIGCEGLEVSSGNNILISDNTADFAAKTVALLKRPGERDALGKAARLLVESRYGWEIIGKTLQQTYERAVVRSTKISAG
jgi:glycosyltransferase involved in cell wall biosynthesis